MNYEVMVMQKEIKPTFEEILKEEFGITETEKDITDEYLSELDSRFGTSEGYFKRLWSACSS